MLLLIVAPAAIGGGTLVHAHERVGPSYLYPPTSVPGAVNPNVTQANIDDTICRSKWTDRAKMG